MHKTEKKIIHFFVMYKMLKFTAKAFSKNWAHAIKVNKNDNKSVLLIKIIDIQKKLDVKNIHDLVDKEIKGRFKTNNLTNEQNKNYKRHGWKLIDGEKFMYANEGFIIPVIVHCRTLKSCKFKKKFRI